VRLLKAFCALIFINVMLCQSVGAERDPRVPMGRLGARNCGLGGAAVALPGSLEALAYNPATLVYLGWPEVVAGFGNQDLGDQRQLYFIGAVPLVGQIVASMGMVNLQYPREEISDFSTILFSIGFPLTPNGQLMAGVNAKFIKQTPSGLIEEASGGGADLGLLYDVFSTSEGMGMQIGISFVDAQTVLKSGEKEIVLPSVYALGTVFHFSKEQLISLQFESQTSQIQQYESFQALRVGVEQSFSIPGKLVLSPRLGYALRFDQAGALSVGCGAVLGDWQADYAFQLPAEFSDAFHQLSISWGYQRTKNPKVRMHKTKNESRPTKEEKTKDKDIFAALDSAVGLEEDFNLFEEEKPKATPTPVIVKEEEEEEEQYTYNMPVPVGPAGNERASLGVAPEMPSFFSGKFSGRRGSGGLSFSQQDIRLHVVVNPFSPNGDGRQDRTIFVGRLVNERLRITRWILTISGRGEVVRYFRGGARLPRNLEWDGKDGKGKKLSDGTYVSVLRVMDEHNMELASATQQVQILTSAQSISFEGPGTRVLGGKTKEKPFTFTFPELLGSRDWKFTILNPAGKQVYQKSGSNRVPGTLAWRPKRKTPLTAGEYTARLNFRDGAGLKSKARTRFRIQFAQFGLTLQAVPELFKPKASGGKGVTLQSQVNGEMKVRNWQITIVNDKNKTMKTFKGKGKPPVAVSWDGSVSGGKAAPGGSVYQAILSVLTSVGTRNSARSAKLQCDVGAYTGKKALSINLVRVEFQPGATELSAKAKEALRSAAKTLTMYKTDYHLELNGHCDNKEAKVKVVELSRERAQIVANFLASDVNVPKDRMQVVGRGSSRPLAKGDSEGDMKKNRRVEIVLYAK
jgi:outer membrane protein OmpA-like peptidoglycan-associated protein